MGTTEPLPRTESLIVSIFSESWVKILRWWMMLRQWSLGCQIYRRWRPSFMVPPPTVTSSLSSHVEERTDSEKCQYQRKAIHYRSRLSSCLIGLAGGRLSPDPSLSWTLGRPRAAASRPFRISHFAEKGASISFVVDHRDPCRRDNAFCEASKLLPCRARAAGIQRNEVKEGQK